MKRVRKPIAGRTSGRMWLRRIAVSSILIGAAACSGDVVVENPVEPSASTTPSSQDDLAGAISTTSPIVTTVATTVATTAATTTTVAATTTTTTVPLPRAPFTGLEVPAAILRPAAVVKIDNHPRALPQWSINLADVVYEELVEARLTRFAAIFHSQDAQIIGPIRSARTGDFALLTNLNRPIFVNSGSNAYTWRALREVETVVVSDANVGKDAFSRSSEKSAPHNLITSTDLIYAAAGTNGGTPPDYLHFRSEGDSIPAATPAQGVDVDFGQIKASYRWDASLEGWARTQNGAAHTDFDGVRVAPENVIIQFVRYRQSPANRATPEPVLTGNGDAWIFTGGRVVIGTWERLSELDVTTYRSSAGAKVGLTPGRTWIELSPHDAATLVP